MNKSEIKITNNIKRYGCHVTSVFDPEGNDTSFTYTVGINQQQNQPELIIMGLRHKLAAWIANEYNRQIKSGKVFKCNTFYDGFINGFKIIFCPVADEYKLEYMLSCNWLYDGVNYDAVQLIYPTVDGVWPWETQATESFKKLQPGLQDLSVW